MMKKRLISIAVILVVIAFIGVKWGKGKPSMDTTVIDTGSMVTGISNYTIGSGMNNTTQVYGTVVASNLASLVTSIQGVVSSLQCQPGAVVKQGAVVATITPANDTQKENSFIQQGYLQQQVSLGEQGIQATLNNLDIQASSLQNQKIVAQQQLALQQANLVNLQKQTKITSGDTQVRIVNTEKSLQNSIRNALTLFDQTFGITSPSKVIQSDAYLGAMNRSGKDKLKTDFLAIKERNELFATMSNTDARKYIADATDFFSLAAQVIVDSIADADHLPKSQLDLLYKTFTENANALLSAKSTFDTLLTSSNTSDLTYDTQINQLESQIKATELSIKNINDQIASITNTRNLQTQQGQSQLLTNQQNLAILQNNLNGEALVAPFDGIVKSVNVQLTNKVTAGSLVCQITPTKVASTKIQIFSSRQIPYATHVLFYNDANTLVTSGNITLELPYKDALTQNYIYEFSNNSLHIKEGTKLRVYFDAPQQTNEIWIPLSYVTPKLEGYFVTKQLSGSKQEVQVQVGDIDNGNIQIVAGLKKGDTITK